jgi:hypothetical protein
VTEQRAAKDLDVRPGGPSLLCAGQRVRPYRPPGGDPAGAAPGDRRVGHCEFGVRRDLDGRFAEAYGSSIRDQRRGEPAWILWKSWPCQALWR